MASESHRVIECTNIYYVCSKEAIFALMLDLREGHVIFVSDRGLCETSLAIDSQAES